jgi:hypothetical protein
MRALASSLAVALVAAIFSVAPSNVWAAHRIDITGLTVSGNGVQTNADGSVRVAGAPSTTIAAQSNVTIQCLYHLERDPQLLPIPTWTGEISVSGKVLRTFVGRINTGDAVEQVNWIAEPAGSIDVRCRLDARAVAGLAEGVRDSHVAVTVTVPSTFVFHCPDLAFASLSGAPAGGTATPVQVTLGLTGSRAEAGRVACLYSSPNRDVRDYLVAFPCLGLVALAAPTTTIVDGSSNTLSLGTPASGGASGPGQFTCRTR